MFLKLGLTSFGGPIAHLGYYRDELVVRRKWIDEAGYADLVALCQFLPGPASSQTGFSLGLLRAGPLGALAAWTAFTLPSALAMVLFAFGAAVFEGPAGGGALHGLKVVAVAVVAQAVWGMARTLCPDRRRGSIALAAVLIVVFAGSSAGQIAAIAAGGLAGLWLCRDGAGAAIGRLRFPVSRRAGATLLAAFLALLVLLPGLRAAFPSQELAMFDPFIAPAPWYSAADTSCCRCWRPRWCKRAGWGGTPSSPDTAPPRPCPARSSPLPPIWGR